MLSHNGIEVAVFIKLESSQMDSVINNGVFERLPKKEDSEANWQVVSLLGPTSNTYIKGLEVKVTELSRENAVLKNALHDLQLVSDKPPELMKEIQVLKSNVIRLQNKVKELRKEKYNTEPAAKTAAKKYEKRKASV